VVGCIDNKLYAVPPFEDVFIASVEGAHNAEQLEKHNITHILCVAPYLELKFPEKYQYKQFDIIDEADEDLSKYMKPCIDYLEQVRTNGGRVLVHCQAGISRSASVCILYMMYKHGMNYDEAYEKLKASRMNVRPNRGFVTHLKEIHKKKFAFE
jgi:dual specificity phosphatase 12